MMRVCLNHRGGFDRLLTAVAASFLTLSATSAMAQADPPRGSAAELAIEAAIPRPEPANVPPPTINDFKMDPKALLREPAKAAAAAAPATEAAKPAEQSGSEPADVATTPAIEPSKDDASNSDTANSDTAKSDTAKSDTAKSD